MNRRADSIASSLLILSGIYFVCFIGYFSAYPFSDALVHLRIAENLADHGRPYFNLAEPVLVSTAHLWVLLLGFVFKVFSPSLAWAAGLSALSTVGCSYFTASILRSRHSYLVSAIIAVLLTSTFLANISAGLSESSFALMFYLASVWAMSRSQGGLSGLFAGLSAAVRPEMILWLVFGFLFSKERGRYFLGALAPVLLVVSFCIFSYGTVVPVGMPANEIIFSKSILVYLKLLSLGWDLGLSEELSGRIAQIVMALIVAYAAVCSGLSRHPAYVRAGFVFSGSLLLAYALGQIEIFQWHWPLIFVPFAVSLILTVDDEKKWAIPIAFILTLSSWPKAFLFDSRALLTGEPSGYSLYRSNSRITAYFRVGEYLNQAQAKGQVLSPEIGGLGWIYKGELLDALARSSTQLLKYLRHPVVLSPDAVREIQPDYVVGTETLTADFLSTMKADPTYPQYQLVFQQEIFPNQPHLDFRGSRHVELFRLKERRENASRSGSTCASDDATIDTLFVDPSHPTSELKNAGKLQVALIDSRKCYRFGRSRLAFKHRLGP